MSSIFAAKRYFSLTVVTNSNFLGFKPPEGLEKSFAYANRVYIDGVDWNVDLCVDPDLSVPETVELLCAFAHEELASSLEYVERGEEKAKDPQEMIGSLRRQVGYIKHGLEDREEQEPVSADEKEFTLAVVEGLRAEIASLTPA